MTSEQQHDTRTVEQLIADQPPGRSLDQRFYVDPEIYELELERIINRNWILAGHQSEIPQPGDFKVFKVGRESAIIVRAQDGSINAFANVCRHRGSLVCLEAHGSTRKFTCPYHGWVYDTDGKLVGARDMPEDFDWGEHGLHKELAEPMALFDFENLKVAACKQYEIPANWKLSIENYQECYHCATAHPDYARMHTLMLDRKKRERVQDHMLEKLEACGLRDIYIDRIDTAARPGEIGYGYSRTALFDGYKTGSRDGSPVAPLLGELTDYDGGASDFSFGGFSFLLAYSDHVVAYVFTPVDLNNSRCDIYWLVRGDAVESKDYDLDELTWLWDVTTKADKSIIVNNSKGVHSRFYQPGPFSGMERAEKTYVEWLMQELQRPA